MQRREVQLHGAESWGGGGWGRTASAPPAGAFEPSGGVVPSRVQAADIAGAGDHEGRPYGSFHADFSARPPDMPGNTTVGDGLVPSRAPDGHGMRAFGRRDQGNRNANTLVHQDGTTARSGKSPSVASPRNQVTASPIRK